MPWRTLEDGSQIDTTDFREYMAAIVSAPPGTFLIAGQPIPEHLRMAECDICHAVMSWNFTKYHVHEG